MTLIKKIEPDSLIKEGSKSFIAREEARIIKREKEKQNSWRYNNLSNWWFGKKS